ncbi:MAG: acyl-homoserine-lactone synthase [Pseudomonadota bacterium]
MSDYTALSAHFFFEESDAALAGKAFRFRHNHFCEKTGWPLKTRNGIEKDEFDTSRTVHCALLSGTTVACYFRANRCDRLYLSAKAFPHLALSRPFPISADYWDISRFGIAHDYRYLSTFLYGLAFRFAIGENVKGLVCILSPARQRQLKQIGLITKPYGPELAVHVDRGGKPELGIACEVPMSEQNFSIVRPMVSLTRHMEIKDETFVFRSGRLRA